MAQVNSSRQNVIVTYLLSGVLVWGLFSAIVIPAGEFPPSPLHILMMALDAVIVFVLAAFLTGEFQRPPSPARTVMLVVGLAGIAAGLGQLAIRFTSSHGWWTGHLHPPVFN